MPVPSRRSLRTIAIAAVSAGCAALAPAVQAAPPAVFNPIAEAQNFSITQQRQAIYDTPSYQAALTADGTASNVQALATEAADPGRLFTDDLCWNLQNGCAGDIRLNDWAARGYGLVRPVLFTARDGATLSGHVWATVAGPAHRPAVVITNGSVQADEQMYWYMARSMTAPRTRSTSCSLRRRTLSAVAQLHDGNQPRRQAGRAGAGRTRCGLQPVLEPARPLATRPGWPLLRRRRRVLYRPVGPAGPSGRGAGQPRRPGTQGRCRSRQRPGRVRGAGRAGLSR